MLLGLPCRDAAELRLYGKSLEGAEEFLHPLQALIQLLA
jgi:hypothetical protein